MAKARQNGDHSREWTAHQMHISTKRYFLERRRHDLALRLIRHEARTCTISECTELSEAQIRRLYQSYALRHSSTPLRRHRGKSPRQVTYFTHNTRTQLAASLLLNLFSIFDLLERLPEPGMARMQFVWRLCDAFEIHQQLAAQMHPQLRDAQDISLEHAWFLLHHLHDGYELRPSCCHCCAGQYLYSAAQPPAYPCPACRLKKNPVPPRLRRTSSLPAAGIRQMPAR